MKNYYCEKRLIDDSLLDCCNKVPIYEIVKMIQMATYNHSQKLNLGHESMIEHSKAFWVISKLTLRLYDEINVHDNVLVSTWTRPLSLIRAVRDSAIKRKNKVLVKAVAEWCCLDYETRSIRKLNSIRYPELEMQKTKFHNIDFCKFTETENMLYVYSKQILASDIDVNLHTNNIKYVNMAMDVFSPDELAKMKINEFEIHFVNQSYYGDEVKVYKLQQKKQFIIVGKVQEKTIFKVMVKTK